MTQFEKTAPDTIAIRGASRTGRYTLMFMGSVALILGIAIVGLIALQLDRGGSVQTQPPAGQLTDGWMASVTAANQAARVDHARRLQDGWSAYLFTDAGEITDGWSSYLLKDEPALVDGWASRYLVDHD